MTGFQTNIRRKTILTVGACVAVGFTASHAFAGFEWIPQKESNAPQARTAPKAPVVEVQEDEGMFLPLPSDSALEEPVAAQTQAPTPAPVATAEPAPEPVVMEPARETSAPTRLSVMPKEEPNSGAIAVQPSERVLPPLEEAEPMAQNEMADNPETLKKPPFEMRNTRVIMPDDAPESARAPVEKQNVTIAPIPSQESLDATAEPAPQFIDPQPMPENMAFEDAVGFAEDVPLALALRQVVPADYAFSFGSQVNPGLRVSWSGGKPWNEVVNDMLTPLDYVARISPKAVHIIHRDLNTMLAPSVPTTPYKLEPAAGTQEIDAQTEAASQPVARERNIKRVNIVDPGAENIQEPTLIEKMTNMFEGDEQAAHQAAAAETNVAEVIIADDAQSEELFAPETPQKLSFWTAQAGTSLKETLAQWSQSANAELVWDVDHDYVLTSDFEAQGSFEKAVSLLLQHGVNAQNDALDHSYVATSNDEKVKILITDKA